MHHQINKSTVIEGATYIVVDASYDPNTKLLSVHYKALRIPVKVAIDSGFLLPLIGSQRRWRLCS